MMDKSMTISVVGLVLYVLFAIGIHIRLDYDATKAICSNLYSQTVNYEACMNKDFQDTVKLIKPIDTEVEE